MLRAAWKVLAGLVATVVFISMSGCAGPEIRRLQVISIPEGATIRQDVAGSTPGVGLVTDVYRTSSLAKNKENGCFLITGYTATWPSGVKASTGLIRWCNTQYPGMTVYIDRPKEAPYSAIDNRPNIEREARQKLAAQQAQIESQTPVATQRAHRSDEPDEDSDASDDEDIGMAGALGIIAQAAANTQASKQRNANQRVTPSAVTSVERQQRQRSAAQQAMAANQDDAAPSGSSNNQAGGGSFDYDAAHPECVVYERHPTLKSYRQYRNTCPFSVQVMYCGVTKNGGDNCSKRIFGSFELGGGATNIAEGSDTSVKFVVCKLPYRAIGAKVTSSGGDGLSVPCQKNK